MEMKEMERERFLVARWWRSQLEAKTNTRRFETQRICSPLLHLLHLLPSSLDSRQQIMWRKCKEQGKSYRFTLTHYFKYQLLWCPRGCLEVKILSFSMSWWNWLKQQQNLETLNDSVICLLLSLLASPVREAVCFKKDNHGLLNWYNGT